jgi:hypothetical protein
MALDESALSELVVALRTRDGGVDLVREPRCSLRCPTIDEHQLEPFGLTGLDQVVEQPLDAHLLRRRRRHRAANGTPVTSTAITRFAPFVRPYGPPPSWNVSPPREAPRASWESITTIDGRFSLRPSEMRACSCNAASTRPRVPLRDQRRNCDHTLVHFPNSAGKNRHSQPACATYNITSTTTRRSGPCSGPRFDAGHSNGSSSSHWSSVRSDRDGTPDHRRRASTRARNGTHAVRASGAGRRDRASTRTDSTRSRDAVRGAGRRGRVPGAGGGPGRRSSGRSRSARRPPRASTRRGRGLAGWARTRHRPAPRTRG